MQKLRELRDEAGYSRDELAKLANIPNVTLRRLEKPDTNGNFETVKKVSKVLSEKLGRDVLLELAA